MWPPRLIRLIAFALVFLAPVVQSAMAQPRKTPNGESKKVVLLHSFGREFKPWSDYARGIRTELERQSQWSIDIIEHSLVTARSSDQDPENPFVDYLHALFAKRPPDLIISVGAPAAAFVQRHRSHLFANTPMVFTAVEQRRIQFTNLTANDAVVAVRINYLAAFQNILQVLPDTKTITVVVGTSPIEKFWREAIAKEVEPIANKVKLLWTDGLTFDELLQTAATLPPKSAIFWELMIVDAAGVVHEGNAALAKLHAAANAPIFSYDESFFGRETVGGPFLLIADTSRETAAVAVRILGGEKAGDIKPPIIEFARPMFDWREMQRWNISESALPAGSTIYFREPTAWEKYRPYILTILMVVFLQGALIAWLVYEHWRRRRAEADSLQRVNELARLNRHATAGELSASIAHEIRQPLSAIASFGSAGLNWLQHKVPNLGEARLALENIIKASHHADDVLKSVRSVFTSELAERVPVDINELVGQVLLLVERPLRINRVAVTTDLADARTTLVMGDPVQLQQVILNLIMNAIEAMSGCDRAARTLHIETRNDQTGHVVLLIRDSGPGLEPKIANDLFKPFVTTKPNGMGMGLSICKTIVEQHRGTLTAASAEPHGAVFQIVWPRFSEVK